MLHIRKIQPQDGRDAIESALEGISPIPVACDTWHPTDNVPKVKVRVAHSSDAIYLMYDVLEPEMRTAAKADGDRVWEDSCVEFFIAPGSDNLYYNFEFSAAGFLYLNGGRPGGRVAPSPEVFSSVKRWVDIEKTPEGLYKWNLVAKIPLSALFRSAIRTLDGLSCKANFYKCGDLLPRPHYLSWAPIDLPKPAFHCPEFFGPVTFEASTRKINMLNNAYCSDKYQYTMGKSYYECGQKDRTAIFNLFYRKAPESNNWAVVSGTEEVIEMVRHLGTEPEEFYEKFLPGEAYAEFRKYLSTMRFTGDIYAMREGEIVFPNQPIVTVVGPLIEAQVLETPMLCILNHQMAVATKASRVTRATNHPVSEFGSRRAHGPWAAVYGAKAAIIAGCASTSNILTGAMNGVPSTGTMAHSFVTSYGSTVEGEHKAFCDYINTHRGENIILLIDTYDTLKCGILNAIRSFRECGIDDSYPYGYGIRLDSGDLAYLSQEVRKILDAHDMKGCKIFATNGLDEYLITDLERQGARIDSYGVGDAIATSKAAPCFGNVYKLVQIDDEPVLKRSEDKIKLINPGFQVTYRILVDGVNKLDVTCLRGDSLEKALLAGEEVTIRDEYDSYKYKTFQAGKYTARPLQIPVIKNGERVAPAHTLLEKKAFYDDTLSRFSPAERRLINPHYYKVDISDDLYNKKMEILDLLVRQIESFKID